MFLQSALESRIDDRSPPQLSFFIRRLTAFKSWKPSTSIILLQDWHPPLPGMEVVYILIAKDIRRTASSNNAPFVIRPTHIERVKSK